MHKKMFNPILLQHFRVICNADYKCYIITLNTAVDDLRERSSHVIDKEEERNTHTVKIVMRILDYLLNI